jgi:hypothetical protein
MWVLWKPARITNKVKRAMDRVLGWSVSSSVKIAIIWINKCLKLYILLVNSNKLRTWDGNKNITKGP